MVEQIDELKEENAKVMEENAKLKERIAQLIEQLEEKKQKHPIKSTSSPPPLKQMKMSIEIESSDMDAKMNDKAANESGKGKNVPNWLIEVLEWIKRIEMADSSLSMSSWAFKYLCWPKLHLNVKPHIVQELKICGDDWRTFSQIPIALVSPPNYIIGFQKIEINILDGRVIKFIENILPILNEFHLSFDNVSSPHHHLDQCRLPIYCLTSDSFAQIHCLFEMLVHKAFAFKIQRLCDFVRLQPKAMDILESIQLIKTNLNKQNTDFLFKWVTTTNARRNQKPKMLRIADNHGIGALFIDKIKKEFTDASHSTNFLIRFINGLTNYAEFVLENEQTKELLTFEFDDRGRKNLIRFKKGEEYLKEKWKNQIKDAPTFISVKITQIGV